MRKALKKAFSAKALGTLRFGLGLLTPLSFLLAAQFMRSSNTVSAWVERPIVIDKMSALLKKAEIRKKLWACLHREIRAITDKPFKSDEEIVVGHYLHSMETPRRDLQTVGSLTQPPQQVPESADQSVDQHLDYARRFVGYAERRVWIPGIAGTNEMLHASPMYFLKWMEDTTGMRPIEFSTSISGSFFPGDHVYECIGRLDSKQMQIGAYYDLYDGRVFWNPIIIENLGDNKATDVLLYITQSLEGPYASTIQRSIRAAGGEILSSESRNAVVRFPIIAGKSHKAFVIASSGSPLQQDQLRVEFYQERSLSLRLVFFGLAIITLLSLAHYNFAEVRDG